MEVFTIKKLGMWISVLVPILLTCTSCGEPNALKQAPEDSYTVQTSSESTSTEDLESSETAIFTAGSSRATTVSSVTASSTTSIVTEKQIFKLVLTTAQEEYPTDVKQIICIIENPTQNRLTYYEGFVLYRLIDGAWESVSIKEGSMFYTMGNVVKSGLKREETLDIEKHYDLPLEPGEYRIVIDGCEKSNTFKIK